jgi:threonine/homoserine/homoserine lactone efflux protein
MSAELLIAFCLFAFVSSITPGPNNLMLLASGLNFGLRRTLPHMLGVSIGFAVMLLAVGAGLTALFQAWPLAYTLLKIVGTVYLVYLAWAIARSGRPGLREAARPMSFWAAAAFQWVNPKAWMMGVTAFAAYGGNGGWRQVLLIALLFSVINLPCVGSWAWVGSRLRDWMAIGRRQQFFNLAMALLLLASLAPMLSAAQ